MRGEGNSGIGLEARPACQTSKERSSGETFGFQERTYITSPSEKKNHKLIIEKIFLIRCFKIDKRKNKSFVSIEIKSKFAQLRN